MNLIKTGIGISKTIKNVARFREILTVLSRHGFSELIVKSGVDKVIPGLSCLPVSLNLSVKIYLMMNGGNYLDLNSD